MSALRFCIRQKQGTYQAGITMPLWSIIKVRGIGPLFELTGDMHADIARIQRWYAPYKGRNHDVLQPAD